MRKLKQPSRGAVMRRLKRAAGHLNATLAMIEARRPCLELAQQLAAVEAAVGVARRLAVSEQMEMSLNGGDADGGTLRHLKRLAQYL